jgi:PKD repeat protein
VSLTDLASVLTCQVNQCEEITVTDTIAACAVELSFVQNANQITITGTGNGASNPSYSIDWGDGSSPAAGPVATHEYSDLGSYPVCVTYTDLNAPGSCTSTICDTVDVTTAVPALTSSFPSLSVFPIPVNGQTQIHVRFERAQNVELQLLDITGRELALLYQGTIGQEERVVFWNAESLPSGVYLIRASGEGESYIQRVMR